MAVAKKILTYVKKGDLVGGMISVPGSLNEQPRMDGAASVFKPAGIDFVQVGVGATEGPALASIEAWYQGHQDVKFMFSSGGSNGVAVATAIQKLGLAKKGIGGAAFDVGVPVLDLIHAGQLAFTVDQQAYLQGAMLNLGAVPLQHHRRADHTHRCRHRLQVRRPRPMSATTCRARTAGRARARQR